jgi:Methyltransferase domain
MPLFGRRLRREGESRHSSARSAVLLASIVLGTIALLRPLSTTTLLRRLTADQILVDYDNGNAAIDLTNPLGIPKGSAVNLPSLREVDSNGHDEIDKARKIYGGKGDGKHLGGFTQLDLQGVSPATWSFMMQALGVHSVLDVGCGKGVSTSWFHLHGCRVQCVEGSHDAVTQSIIGSLDPNLVVEHDFSRGPWWPEETFDAVWAVEFLEHVGVNYQFNYVTAFRKAALLFVTSSRVGGWHHVEVHQDEWWIRKYESYGFRYDPQLTEEVRNVALIESRTRTTNQTAPNGAYYNAQHIWLTMKVFVNPTVASLPEHAHLFPEHGCYGGKVSGKKIQRVCGEGKDGRLESVLPKEFWPLPLDAAQDEAWADLLRQHMDSGVSAAAEHS